MLSGRQVGVLIFYAAVLWAAATAWIRLAPTAIADAIRGDLGYVTSVPVCWLCIVLMRRLARLADTQMLAAASLVVGVAALIDASVLRWSPDLYGSDEHVLRLGAAWLLWGYGITLVMVLLMQRRGDRGAGTVVRDGTIAAADRTQQMGVAEW